MIMPHIQQPGLPATSLSGPVAYLTSEYPKISHTFILREVQTLRSLGIKVLTCSVRRPNARDLTGVDEKEALRDTFFVLAAAKNPLRLIANHAAAFTHSPRRWLSALRLALRTRSPGAKAVLWQLFYFLEAGLLAEHLRQNGVRHLHCHFANSGCSVAMLTAEMSGISYSFTLHGPYIFFEPMRWRLDEKIARARFVACISHFCRAQAMLFSEQMYWEKLRIVHCGIDPNLYGQAPRTTFGKHIVFIGRFDAAKGVTLLLDAFSALRARHPDALLTLVGDGPMRGALETQAQTLGLAGVTRFTGYLSQGDVSALLAETDMLALPSFAEGLPVVLMEAFASRIPVVVSQIAGTPELVREGVSGFLVPAGDVATLTDRLDRLLSDPDLCRRMGEAGRTMVEVEHDIAREVAWLAALCNGTGEGLRPSH